MSHVPMCPGAAKDVCLLWNYNEVLGLLRAHQCVVAVFSGERGMGSEHQRHHTPQLYSAQLQCTATVHSYSAQLQCTVADARFLPAAGHDHEGGYRRDQRGIHHLTFQSPLNSMAADRRAAATVELW